MRLCAGSRHGLRFARHLLCPSGIFRWMFAIGLVSAFVHSKTLKQQRDEEYLKMIAVGGGAELDRDIFSKEWMDEFRLGEPGFCERALEYYEWRVAGWGSNMNCALATWVAGNIHGRKELAINVSDGMFAGLKCLSRSKARVESGWGCIFKPMAHLCTFESKREWQHFIPSLKVSGHERQMAITTWHRAQLVTRAQASKTLQATGSGMDAVAVSAVMLDYMRSHMQPWIREDIDSVLNEGRIAALRSSNFVGLHIRRGDKIVSEAKKVETQVYVNRAAALARQSSGNHSAVNAITGIWLCSDDSSVITEVKRLAPRNFPNVRLENIVWISDRMAVGPPHPNVKGFDELPTTVQNMTYSALVGLFAELEMLSEANVFVGTFTSNVARYVLLLRETKNFPRRTTASVDREDWSAGRRLRRH